MMPCVTLACRKKHSRRSKRTGRKLLKKPVRQLMSTLQWSNIDRMIRVQAERLRYGRRTCKTQARPQRILAAAVIFVGTMRDLSDGAPISAMTLEHYPGMTEKALTEIDAEAHRRWPLLDTLIVHRYGNARSRVMTLFWSLPHQATGRQRLRRVTS